MAILDNLRNFSWLYFAIILTVVYFCFNLKLTAVQAERDKYAAQATQQAFALATQNKAIEEWQREAELAQIKLTDAEKLAAQHTENYQRKLTELANQEVPEDCKSAIRWGALQAIKMRKQ